MSTKLEKLRQHQAQVEVKIQQVEVIESTEEKKEDTRRKILIGEAIFSRLVTG